MNVYYTKTALYAYPNLQAIADQIDELVEKKAFASISDYSSALSQCEKIVDFTFQKDALFALKLRLEDILSKLSQREKDCLEYKYFKRKPKEYFIGFDFESRGYFRAQQRLAKKISSALEKDGGTDEWFEQTCLHMDFFKELLKRTIEHEKSYVKKKKTQPKKQTLSCENIRLTA